MVATGLVFAPVMAETASAAGEQRSTTQPAANTWSTQVDPKRGVNGTAYTPEQIELINAINAYFNKLDNAQGRFVQTGADRKRMKGKFYLKRPGKFRFQYARPSRMVIVSDGKYMAIQDHDLNTDDRIALDNTPFRLLLRRNVNILRDAQILELQTTPDLAIIAIRDKRPDMPGSIKLFMARQPALELKEWVTTDQQGLATRVQLRSIDTSKPLSSKLFKPKAIMLPRF
ncbi:MAG: outer-membrane lipoprotein carrier protein LolA [Pseudomonadota bacterium]